MTTFPAMAYVEQDGTPAFEKGGKSYPARVTPGYWSAVCYGGLAVRACPLEAFAAACQDWLDMWKSGYDRWGQAFVGDVTHSQGCVAEIIAPWGPKREVKKVEEPGLFAVKD